MTCFERERTLLPKCSITEEMQNDFSYERHVHISVVVANYIYLLLKIER